MRRLALAEDAIYSGNLILVNQTHPLQAEDYHNQLVPLPELGEDLLLEARTATLLRILLDELQLGRQRIVVVSGFRSQAEQLEIFQQTLLERGEAFTRQYVALPGHSEHQTGMAVDLALAAEQIDFIRPDFPYSGLAGRFRARAADFGFIERYPLGKEEITGIAHEPWHFRYVGLPHARLMKERGLTLEEYTLLVREHRYGRNPLCDTAAGQRVEVGFLPAAGGQTWLNLPAECPCQISGNNRDGFVITCWTAVGCGRCA